MQHREFDYFSEKDFLREYMRMGPVPPYAENAKALGSPVKIGDRAVKNRLVVQPVEGLDANPDGSPGEGTFERYRRCAGGGSGMIWLESVSVCEMGRSASVQLWITRENAGTFLALRKAMDDAAEGTGRPYAVLQITHSGRLSRPHGTPVPVCAVHNPYLPKDSEYILSDDALAALEEEYVAAALLAEQAGFDAVDIRSCHGYLTSELLGARTRPGRYGGSFESRTRFLLNVIDRIRAKSGIELAVRLNVFDGVPFPYGFGVGEEGDCVPDMREPLQLVELLGERGVRLLNISSGIGGYSPQVIRPSDKGGESFEREHPLEGIGRMLRLTRQVKEAAPDAVVIASAFTWLREFAAGVAAGGIENAWFDMAGFGRQALCYPGYAKDILTGGGMRRENCCTTCNACMASLKGHRAVRCIKERG